MTEQEKVRLDEILQQAAMQLIKAQTYLRQGKLNMLLFMWAMCRICCQG